MLENFDYVRSLTLKEALTHLNKENDSVFPIAGGTDILVQARNKIIHPKKLVDIKRLDELNFIENHEKHLYIGGSVTFNEIIESDLIKEHFPLLIKASQKVGSPGIRNLATIAGNVQTASPAGDGLVVLYASNTLVELISEKGKREITIENFIKGPKKTAKQSDEIIVGFKVPKQQWNFEEFLKVGKRNALAISIVNGVVRINFNEDNTIKNIRIVLGAVGPTPIRLARAEEFLIGKTGTEEVIKECKKIIKEDISPISDIRGSSDYRRHIAAVHCCKLIDLAKGGNRI